MRLKKIGFIEFFRSLLFISLLLLGNSAKAQQPDANPPAPPAIPLEPNAAPAATDAHENLDALTLEGTNFKPDDAFLVETDDLKGTGFIRHRYRMQWRPLDALDLYVILPRGVKNPPVVLYLYDFPADTERFKNNGWCERVTSQGYAAVGFVSALTGHRYHDRPMKEWFISELRESLVSTVHDVQYILNYLETRNDLDMSRVGMFGVGSGGTIAILASGVEPRIRVVDALSPWGDWPDWVAGTNRVRPEEHAIFGKPEYLARVAPFDPVQWISKVKAQRIRIQYIRSNSEVPVKSQEQIEASAPPTTVINQFGDDMAFHDASVPAGRAFEWVKAQLKGDGVENLQANKEANTHFFPAAATGKLPDPMVPFDKYKKP